MALVSALTLLLSATRLGKLLLGVTIIGGLAVLCFSVWLHKKECEVYHRNIIRYLPPR